MAIFDLNDFNYRRVVKLAPDAFITVNGAFGSRILSPVNTGGTQDISIQGGIVSISTNSAVSPPGAGKATIQIVAPEYTGLHTKSTSSNSAGYWVTLPSGAKVPYFIPMMEICIFMKGRFLDAANKMKPTYYRTFWGFITNMSEDYSDGTFRISLQCNDMLGWWNYQKLMVSPNEFAASLGGPDISQFSTIFKNKNPWRIIIQLLYETQWQSSDGNSTYSFLQTKYSNIYTQPAFGNFNASIIGTLAVKMNEYWKNRFNFFGESMQLEMFGILNRVAATKNITSIDAQNASMPASKSPIQQSSILQKSDVTDKGHSEFLNIDLGLDYNLLARVQPFADFDLYGVGGQTLEMSKLDIAKKMCDSVHMEFYEDMNGIIVFKPPFYNLDVTRGDIPYYVIESSEIISSSASTDTDHICNYMEVTAPQSQYIPNTVQIAGLHIDWESMLRYGIRYQRANIAYGNDAKSLALIAAAEMGRVNAEATTGHVSIPLRPEMRLGYPIYLAPKDVYYYVVGIAHSFSFGVSATTELSLIAKRDRIYDATGEYLSYMEVSDTKSAGVAPAVGSSANGKVMRGFVQKFLEKSEESKITIPTPIRSDAASKHTVSADVEAHGYSLSKPEGIETEQEAFLRITGAKAGAKVNGVYKIVPAELTPLNNTTQNPLGISNATGDVSTIMSNQILMMTKSTIPYTDIRGYKHIGAFPYGANLILNKSGLDDSPEISTKAYQDYVANIMVAESKTPDATGSNTPTVPKPTSGLSESDKVAAAATGNVTPNQNGQFANSNWI